MKLAIYQLIYEIYPLIVIFLLYFLNYLSFKAIILIYICYCIYNRLTSTIKVNYASTNSTLNQILNKCPSILQPHYKPHFLLSNSILQLLTLDYTVNYMYPKEYTEETKYVPIGDTGIRVIYYSYKEISTYEHQPILMFFPGLTGNHTERYSRNIIHEAILNGFRVIVYQMRMLSPCDQINFTNKDKECYNYFEDVGITMNYLSTKHPNVDFYGIGCSFGALQLTGYLGSEYNKGNKYFKAAVSISNPYDMLTSSKICRGSIYDTFLLSVIRKNFVKNFMNCNKVFKVHTVDVNKVLTCEESRDFDNEFTRKILGCAHTDDYYRKISVSDKIKNISIPILFIHAMDDNITTQKAIPYDDIDNNNNCVSIWVQRGAHLCFIEQGKHIFELKQWMTTPVVEFIKAASQVL